MLSTNERGLLLESLRPPDDYELDFAITTTFTLDLISLLIAPLGFTFFELEGDPSADVSGIDPLILLRTLRKYADRIAVFCQAGRIAKPRMQQPLFAALEGSVVPVKAAMAGGIFHPKVWVLRYVSQQEPVHYRVICQTRNLTFDNSWDTSLALDGKLVDRKLAYSANNPLGDFVAALPSLAIDEVPQPIRQNVKTAATELRRVDFVQPDPFDSYMFHPLGIAGYTKDPIRPAGRTLVISPFLTPGAVEQLGFPGSDNVLISRADALDTLSKEQLAGFDQIYTLEPSAEAELEVDTPYAQDRLTPAAGLHAKLFVVEEGWNSYVWTGSANATDAAFNKNVEFLVALGGKKSVCGIECLLGATNDQTALRNFLSPYTPRTQGVECDALQKELEEALESARTQVATRQWKAAVQANGPTFDLTVGTTDASPLLLERRVSAKIWPITLTETAAKPIKDDAAEFSFRAISLEALTAFFALDLSIGAGEREIRTRFVIRATLSGAPSDRREALLNYYLKDPAAVIRFLLLLLTADDASTDASADEFAEFGSQRTLFTSGPAPEALLEALLRAFHRNPATLDSVAKAIEDLRKTNDGSKLIPDGFDRIWSAVWAAHEKTQSRERALVGE
jgi:hypothetical protein